MLGGVRRRLYLGVGVDSVVGGFHGVPQVTLTFRSMSREDLDAVMEIERCSFPQPWSPGLFLH